MAEEAPLYIYLPAANGEPTLDRYHLSSTNPNWLKQVKDKVAEGSGEVTTGHIALDPDTATTLQHDADEWNAHLRYTEAMAIVNAYETARPTTPAPPKVPVPQ